MTGRTHQIRVHLAAIGHPVVGDAVYGRRSELVGRQFLHAWRLAFDLPSSGRRVGVRVAAAGRPAGGAGRAARLDALLLGADGRDARRVDVDAVEEAGEDGFFPSASSARTWRAITAPYPLSGSVRTYQ